MRTGVNVAIAVLTLLSPLLTRLSESRLISEWYQPALNITADRLPVFWSTRNVSPAWR